MEAIILVILFGLVWGSFLNVIIYRLPISKNIVFPPSACPECKKRIHFYDNIPVISYIILWGKCRHCRSSIPFSYFLVELITPLSFYILFINYFFSLHFFICCLFTSALIVLTFIDYFHQIIPDEITMPGIILVFIYAIFRSDMILKEALIGAAAGAGFLLTLYIIYLKWRKKEGLGMGDVVLMLFIGAFLGLKLTILTLILGSFSGAAVGAFVMLRQKENLQYALPFGTFLAPAAFVSLIWGNTIIHWYLNLFKTIP